MLESTHQEVIYKCTYCNLYYINGQWVETKEPYKEAKETFCPKHYQPLKSELERDIEEIYKKIKR